MLLGQDAEKGENGICLLPFMYSQWRKDKMLIPIFKFPLTSPILIHIHIYLFDGKALMVCTTNCTIVTSAKKK